MAGVKNTQKMKINLNSFQGGESSDFKYGTTGAFYNSQALDFRSKISQMSVLPGFRNITNTLSDLITAMVQDPNGVRYGVGNKGYLYKISIAGVLTQFGQMTSNGGAGLVYNNMTDQLYFSGQQDVSIYGQLTNGSPQLRLGNFGANPSIGVGVNYIYDSATNTYDIPRNNILSASAAAGGSLNLSNYTSVTNTLTATTTIGNSITETTNSYCSFIPDIEPFYSIPVYITTIGTGDLTLTLHDSLNNNLGAVTITHANVVVGWNNFVFSSPGVRAIVSGVASLNSTSYHWHLTSSVSSDTAAVATYQAGNMQGANFLLFAYRLVQTNNGWHPMALFNGYLLVGNGRYLSTYTFSGDNNTVNATSGTHGAGWDRHAFVLDYGYEVCGISVNNQMAVIAAEKRSTNTNKSFQDGFLYFWDGQNATLNFKIEIPMGAPYSVYTFNNITYFYVAGSLFAWGGGQQVIKVRYMAYQNTDYLGVAENTIVNPNMIDSRYNLLMLGYPSSTTNINTSYGIYSWGAVELVYPNSFGYSYSLANQSQNYSPSNNLQIGTIKNFVDTMYMSWTQTTGGVTQYGLDILDNTSTPAQNYLWQSLIWDGGVRYKTKKALRLKISFLPLPANTTLTAQYSLERGGWVSSDPSGSASFSAVTGDTSVIVEFNNARFKEIQFGFFGTCTSASSAPTITGVTLEVDPLEDEVSLRKDAS